ncbi:MAG TPA: acylphosphatase [Gammaproteobacteria bacterium]|nr:acylphosphatase [Gammaproteobacteria bacterium]
MDPEISIRGTASGRVQGVGFRYFVLRHAEAAGLRGYVRNLSDGRVEFLLRGAPAGVDTVIEQIRIGPAHAWVADVATTEDTIADAGSGFVIR